MNVRTLCLAVLNCSESTGYEIRKLVSEGHFSHFVDASYGSIYPALAKMEQEGLVTAREEFQPGKPPRKVYSVTDEGRDAFLVALTKPAQKDIFKSEFLLLAMCAEMMQPDDVRRAVDTQLDYLAREIQQINEEVAQVDLAGATWVADYGRTCLQASIDYVSGNRKALEAIAGTGIQALRDTKHNSKSSDGEADTILLAGAAIAAE
ncbi:MAG: PadR family transcriptional regulator [Pseudomonadota bacterium]